MTTRFVHRIELPAAAYGLDQDGWIEIKTKLRTDVWQRLRWLKRMIESGPVPDGERIVQKLAPQLIVAWDIAIDGRKLKFNKSQIIDLLPVNVWSRVMTEYNRANFHIPGDSP